jgi:hypothetical protein
VVYEPSNIHFRNLVLSKLCNHHYSYRNRIANFFLCFHAYCFSISNFFICLPKCSLDNFLLKRCMQQLKLLLQHLSKTKTNRRNNKYIYLLGFVSTHHQKRSVGSGGSAFGDRSVLQAVLVCCCCG